jgi:hypothetical protein
MIILSNQWTMKTEPKPTKIMTTFFMKLNISRLSIPLESPQTVTEESIKATTSGKAVGKTIAKRETALRILWG